jgi:hypothetical protein
MGASALRKSKQLAHNWWRQPRQINGHRLDPIGKTPTETRGPHENSEIFLGWTTRGGWGSLAMLQSEGRQAQDGKVAIRWTQSLSLSIDRWQKKPIKIFQYVDFRWRCWFGYLILARWKLVGEIASSARSTIFSYVQRYLLDLFNNSMTLRSCATATSISFIGPSSLLFI